MFALMWINISETKLYFLVLLPAQKPTVKNFTSVSANTHIYRLVFCKKEKKKRPRDNPCFNHEHLTKSVLSSELY